MVRVSPAARKSKLLSAALNVAVTNPPPGPLLIEVVSADPSTALSPPGGVSPPDQVIEARLTLSVLGVELVKLKLVVGAVSSPELPVMWGISMIGCTPAPGASSGGGAFCWETSKPPELLWGVLMVTMPAAAPLSGPRRLIG